MTELMPRQAPTTRHTIPKSGKNRMHVDVETRAVDDEVARLEGLGAYRIVVGAVDEHGNRGSRCPIPKGNEFCACDSGQSGPRVSS
jgi:hypothetical protein